MLKIFLLLLVIVTTTAAHAYVRTLTLYANAWAASSVNVLANQSNTLITDGDFQYAAFYAADTHLVVARRKLNEDKWETHKTDYTGKVTDAHNTVSIAVDGDGYLHVAWDHHANALNYCRGVSPHSLELGPKIAMTGMLEKSVTYPLFFRRPDGGLLFLYRDGRSGKGNVVLNRYDLPGEGGDKSRMGVWRQVHENLIDGEGARSAYLAAAIDPRGDLHLAWNWRDTPDVSTNHDLCYAKSADGGKTWTTTSGAPLTLPITAATAEYALRIPQQSTMMNPPSLTTDAEGHPFIVTYWTAAGTDVPQFQLVRHDGSKWSVNPITQRTQAFNLQGTSTKRPPISRGSILTKKSAEEKTEVYLVYRDDKRGGRIILSTCEDLQVPAWRMDELTPDSVGAWEPSIDIVQWQRFGQIHLLVQAVQQQDGNDSTPTAVAPSPISTLIWNPSTK